jgi:hypothetical protein
VRWRGIKELTVYHLDMGLFRRRARKNHENAAADLLKEETRAAEADVEVARREVTAEVRPNPDQPGWGRTIGQEIGRSREGAPAKDDNGLRSSPQ